MGFLGKGGGINVGGGIESNLSSSLSISSSSFPFSHSDLLYWSIDTGGLYFSLSDCEEYCDFSRFYGLGGRGESATGFVLGCLLGKRLGILRVRLWVWALYVLDFCRGSGL